MNIGYSESEAHSHAGFKIFCIKRYIATAITPEVFLQAEILDST